MRVTIHQPAYLPWLGLMSKIAYSDIYVCLDNVQYSKDSFDNRNRILWNNEPKWLTIPVETSGKFGENPLNEARVNDNDWRRTHLQLITQSYRGLNNNLLRDLNGLYRLESDLLFDYSRRSMDIIKEHLDIKVPIFFSSQLNLESSGSQMILDICKSFKATEYVSGPFGKDYLDINSFNEAGIKVVYHNFDLRYNLSAIHYLFTLGDEETRKLILSGYNITE